MNTLKKIAEENGLEIVDVWDFECEKTKAIVGFKDFEQAKQVAEDNDMELVWIRLGFESYNDWVAYKKATEPIEIDDYFMTEFTGESSMHNCVVSNTSAAYLADEVFDEIMVMCSEEDSYESDYDDIFKFTEKSQKLIRQIRDLEDDEVAIVDLNNITSGWKFIQTEKKYSVDFTYIGSAIKIAAMYI